MPTMRRLSQRSPPAVLLAVAAPAEGRAVLAGIDGDPALAESAWVLHRLGRGLHLVVTGIGKANAAAGVALVLDPAEHAGVISLGIAGALAGPAGEYELGSVGI